MSPRRLSTRLLLLGCALTLLVACAASSGQTGTLQPTASPSGSNVTLVFWHGWAGTERQALSRLTDDFNRQRASGRVLAQAMPLATFSSELRAQALAGAGPHIALIPSTWLGSLARDGVLLPLDQVITTDEIATLLPATVGAAQATGSDGNRQLYGLPISFDTLALFYNRANISDAPADTNVLISLAHGLNEPPLWGLAFNLSLDTTIGYLYAFGGRVFDESGTPALAGAGRAGTEQWLTWLARLNNDPKMLVRPDTNIQVDRELKNNQVVMTVGWAHQLADFRRLWGDQVGVAPLPRLSDTGELPQPYIQSWVLVINRLAGPAERQAAVEYLRAMIASEAQQRLLENDIQPTRQDLTLDAANPQNSAARAFRSQAQTAQPMPNSPERERIRQILRRMQQVVLANQATPADAVSQADAQLRALLKLPAR